MTRSATAASTRTGNTWPCCWHFTICCARLPVRLPDVGSTRPKAGAIGLHRVLTLLKHPLNFRPSCRFWPRYGRLQLTVCRIHAQTGLAQSFLSTVVLDNLKRLRGYGTVLSFSAVALDGDVN